MNLNLPISFLKKAEYELKDYRFIEVTIDVMHTGKNLNGTSFEKSVIDKAVPTICNTPILGYVVNEGDDDTKDFRGHEHELRITDDTVKYVYSGQAYGVVPESCNPRWIVKDDGNGVEREYLQVDGLIWTKFSDPVDIFVRDITKAHSVELTDMILGKADEKGYTPVTAFKFDGCCILSTTDPKIQPAMTSSCITANFSVEDIAAQIRDRLYEYQAARLELDKTINEKGDKSLMENTEMNIVQARNVPEILPAENIETVTQGFTAKSGAPTSGESTANPAVDTTFEGASSADSNENQPKETEQQYSLSTAQIQGEILAALDEFKVPAIWDETVMVHRYWFEDIQDNIVIVRDYVTRQLMGIPFTMNGDNVVLDPENAKHMKVTYEEWDNGEVLPGTVAMFTEMVDALEKLTKSYNEISSSLNEIKPKYESYVQAEAEAKEAKEKEQRATLFTLMDKQLGEDPAYTVLKNDKELCYSELETKCYALVGRKKSAEFSYIPNNNDTNSNVRFGVDGTQTAETRAYDGLIERYRANK